MQQNWPVAREIDRQCVHKAGRPSDLDRAMRLGLVGGYRDAPPCRTAVKRPPEFQSGEIAQAHRPQRQESDRESIAMKRCRTCPSAHGQSGGLSHQGKSELHQQG